MKKETKTIAVTYEKGGVGKTTTAVNVAAILANKGSSVLLVDLDPQTYATGYFGLYSDDRPSVYDVLVKELPAAKAIIPTGFDRLDILPATHSLETAETHLASLPYGQEYKLKDALAEIAEQYDYILLDCPPAGMRIKTNAMAAADGLLLPTIPDDYAIQGLVRISKQLVNIRRGMNPQLRVYGVLLTLDEHNANKKAYKAALQQQTLFPCFRQTIRKNTALSAAINARQPIIYYDKRCNGAQDYLAFTDELLEVINRG